jgi:hypothetical protein
MMAVVQDYMNMSMSLRVGNRTMTDVEYELPDDVRSVISDLKVSDFKITRSTVAASAVDQSPGVSLSGSSVLLVFFSHPVAVKELADGDISASSRYVFTSFVGFARNMVGDANFMTAPFLFDNCLQSTTVPPYNSYHATDNHVAVEMTVVELVLIP